MKGKRDFCCKPQAEVTTGGSWEQLEEEDTIITTFSRVLMKIHHNIDKSSAQF